MTAKLGKERGATRAEGDARDALIRYAMLN